MLIKGKDIRYISMDKTFCMSAKCPIRDKCNRSYFKLIGDEVVFPEIVSMGDFYHQNAECEYYIGE